MEICVVSAIIAILVALTISTTKSAMVAGKRTKCLSNQRQLALAINGYAGEHNGEYPLYSTNNSPDDEEGGNWHRRIQSYLQTDFAQKTNNTVNRVYVCPADTGPFQGVLSYGMNTSLRGLRTVQATKNVILVGDSQSAAYSTTNSIKYNHNLTANAVLLDGSAVQLRKEMNSAEWQKLWSGTN